MIKSKRIAITAMAAVLALAGAACGSDDPVADEPAAEEEATEEPAAEEEAT
ncbi:MAG TPA: BMP family ABC transporter substrate-binding protein, partial [Acidimicrobiaceae bacterium]|nr:BMP family ABC transporter substrate-binding protein [Acidimicrobiaceae bacterium]